MNKITQWTNGIAANKAAVMLVAGLLAVLTVVPAFAQDGGEGGDVTEVTLELNCFNSAGEEVNNGLGTITAGGDPNLLLRDPATSSACAALAAELLLSELSEEQLASLGFGGGASEADGSGDLGSMLAGADGGDEDTTAPPAPSGSGVNTLGTPIGPAEDVALECEDREGNDESTSNGVRIRAFLPSGSYKATLLPARFQTFDPILFIDTGTARICSTQSPAAREYVVDFSRAEIGGQVFGHISGGTFEFEVEGSATELSPVEFVVGGQDGETAGTSGEFVLILEGGRLTQQANSHIYNVTMTDSLFSSDVPLSVIALGVSENLDPNLQAGIFDGDQFLPVFTCENAGEGDCQSLSPFSLEGTSVVEAAVRTTRGDEDDAAISILPGTYTAEGIQEVSFIVSELEDDTLSREEYVIVFYGGIE